VTALPAVLAASVLLAGCAVLPGVPATPKVSPQALAQCAARADSDPAVLQARINANSELQEVHVPGVRLAEIARQRAINRCLAGEGLAPVGGVEPVEQD
jgi:hypothetical protein